MDDNSKFFTPRGLPRVPLKLRVNMEFEKFSGFISEYSENISEGGMFIKTSHPKSVGTIFSLEFKLKDDYKLIQGWGEVVWVREKMESPKKPAGMGIKFLDLDQASKELIRNIIRIHKKEPSKDDIHPFDFMDDPAKETKPQSPANLSGIAKEVFGDSEAKAQTESKSPMDSIFKDIKTEMDSGESPKIQSELPFGAPETKPPPMPTQATEKKDASKVDDADFVEEVFGKDEAKTSSEIPDKPRETAKEKTKGKDPYRKVSWYSNPSSIMIVVVFAILLLVAFSFHKNIVTTFTILKNYYIEKKESRKKTKVPSDTTTRPVIETRKVPEKRDVEKAEPPKKVIDPNFIKKIKLARYKNGAMKAIFTLARKPGKGALQHEMLSFPPRYSVKIAGIDRLYKRHTYSVANPNLKKIRMGLHDNPKSIHIVFDLGRGVTKDRVVFSETSKGFTLTVRP